MGSYFWSSIAAFLFLITSVSCLVGCALLIQSLFMGLDFGFFILGVVMFILTETSVFIACKEITK